MNSLPTIQGQLRQMLPGLRIKYHISELGLFGSVVRDDFNRHSDVDILVSKRTPGLLLEDILDSINKISSYTAGIPTTNF